MSTQYAKMISISQPSELMDDLRFRQGTGLPAALYGSHSLRRGFATWATRSGWDHEAQMGYVGRRDAKIEPVSKAGGAACRGWAHLQRLGTKDDVAG